MDLIEHTKGAIRLAEASASSLSDAVLRVEGMSSAKVRHLLNNLVKFEGCRYLEIGCWKGSTLISALLNNRPQYWAIDNWSEYGGPRDELLRHCREILGEEPALIDRDFVSFDPRELGI